MAQRSRDIWPRQQPPARENILFESDSMTIGHFRCPTNDPSFEDTGPIAGHVIVFPRTAVTITHEGQEPVVADPSTAMLYNRGQLYRRGRLHERGDISDWIGFGDDALVEAMSEVDPHVKDRPESPFRFTHGPAANRLYLRQRMLVEFLRRTPNPDALAVEEEAFDILRQSVRLAYAAWSDRRPARSTRTDTAAAHRDLAQHAKSVLVRTLASPVGLDEIAREVHASPHHLCRVFRAQTGMTMNAYRNEMRVRFALEHLPRAAGDMTNLALDLGFSSHSHFTRTFKQAFGVTPASIDLAGRHGNTP